MLNRVRLWLRTVLCRRRLEREMREEMAGHLERAVERFLASGMTPEEARAAARREFGHVDALQEEARDARGARGIESLVADVGFGLRLFRRKPFVTATMVCVLALGIGFNTALFLLAYSALNGPPAGMALDPSLVRIRGIDRSRGGSTIGREFSYPEYSEYASQRHLFSAAAAWTSSDVVLQLGPDEGSLHSGAATYVTADYFRVLGVRLIGGAGLPADARDRTEPQLVAVISHVLWDQYFGRTPDVVGKTLKVNDVPVTIVGVAPRRFAGARTGGSHMRVWLPLNARPLLQRGTAAELASFDAAVFGLVARVQPGIDVGETMPTVQTIAARAEQQMTRSRGAAGLRTTDVVALTGSNYFPPSGQGAENVVGRIATLFIPVLILLITCTNVSALLAGLAVARRREIAVRLALGAGRRRIVRQLVTESVLLALAAGALGMFVVYVLWRFFDASIPDIQLLLDWRGVAFTFGVALATGILFGVSPALHGTRLALSDVLKDSAGVVAARNRLQSGLVIAQIAFTQPALLTVGALMLELTSTLDQRPATVFADRIVEARFNTNPRYGSLDDRREQALRRLQTRLASLPGVVGVVPQENGEDHFEAAAHPPDRGDGVDVGPNPQVRAQSAPPGYFSLMGVAIVRGRAFTEADTADSNAVVIGDGLARRLWGSADPIGRRLISATPNRRGANVFEVVGVVDEGRGSSRDAREIVHSVYMAPVRVTGHFLIRTRGPADPVIPLIRSVANAEVPELPLISARTLEAIENGERRTIVNVVTAVGGSGVVALFVSAIGLYAVVAFAVGQRIREVGIRTALGADRRQIVSLFLFRGLRLSLIGLFVGLTLSTTVVRLTAVLRGQQPPAGIALLAVAVAGVVLAVALVATWIPARRAANIDPLLALRIE
jgi:predicted permease